MTVAELIEELRKQDQWKPVMFICEQYVDFLNGEARTEVGAVVGESNYVLLEE